MKAMKQALSALLLLYIFFLSPVTAYAADFRTGNNINIGTNEKNLSDLYVAGGDININTKINNDLTVVGGNIQIDGEVTNELLVAGGNLTIRSDVTNNTRIAGGNILIEGTINRDLVVAGGSVTIARDAKIQGDLVFVGGQLSLNGPVRGNVTVNGGEVTINNTVGGKVQGNVSELILSSNAEINGDLRYTAPERARLENGAVVKGKHEFKEDERREQAARNAAAFLTAGQIYKLVTDIVFALLFVYLLTVFTKRAIENAVAEPLKSAGLGLVFLIVMPILSLMLLIAIWLGVASFLLYLLVILISLVIGKLLIGWWILNWWSTRSKRVYLLDWKAALLGPVAIYLLAKLPIIGWLAIVIIYLFAIGAVTQELLAFISGQRNNESRGVRPTTRPALTRPSRSRPAARRR
ncbi:MAG: hypothetical protein HY428_01945 [Candidatus Levybacteria bacterium]|nr:hypothetical protein [Candidatus Levybacteria bacterium]